MPMKYEYALATEYSGFIGARLVRAYWSPVPSVLNWTGIGVVSDFEQVFF